MRNKKKVNILKYKKRNSKLQNCLIFQLLVYVCECGYNNIKQEQKLNFIMLSLDM